MNYRTWTKQFTPGLVVIAISCLVSIPSKAQFRTARQDTTRQDTIEYKPLFRPTFTPVDRYGDPFSNNTTQSPLFLKDPKSMKLEVLPDTGKTYSIYEKLGRINFRSPSLMTFQEVNQLQNQSIIKIGRAHV